MIVCNTRNLGLHLTGVQRYTSELLARFPAEVKQVAPSAPWRSGMKGHAWEQFLLPVYARGQLLWSPSNTGPLGVSRQVVSVMDMSPLDHPEWMGGAFTQWYSLLLPRLVHVAQAVITISRFSRDRILHWCPQAADKVHVTHLAADQRFKKAGSQDISNMRKALGISFDRYFVALGSLEPRKNLPRLLEAWREAQKSLPEGIGLVLAGAQGRALVFGNQSLQPLPPRVHLTGHVSDQMLPALYSGATGSIYLSLYEGFGLPPLEAMSCGTPVICSDRASLPEVVGDAALLVDPIDTRAITDALLSLADDGALSGKLSKAGLLRAQQFSWEKTAEQTWAILQRAM
jgi:glycosyltransferase involved in cell wall biosynthesis